MDGQDWFEDNKGGKSSHEPSFRDHGSRQTANNNRDSISSNNSDTQSVRNKSKSILRRAKVRCGACLTQLGEDFRFFVLETSFVGIAIAFVVAESFVDVINQFVVAFITPAIALIIGKPDFSALIITISGTQFFYGTFINASISFLIISAVVFFFVVVPFLKVQRKLEIPKRDCPFCLSEIPQAACKCAFCASEVEPIPQILAPRDRSLSSFKSKFSGILCCTGCTKCIHHDSVISDNESESEQIQEQHSIPQELHNQNSNLNEIQLPASESLSIQHEYEQHNANVNMNQLHEITVDNTR